MTDRHAGYVVALEDNMREDDAEATLNAIRQIKGVQAVQPVVADAGQQIGEARARTAVILKVGEALHELMSET